MAWNQLASDIFQWEAGKAHYKLLAYLSQQLPKDTLIADLGTLNGASAIALATNPDVKVLTYDISDQAPKNELTYKQLPNIQFINRDCLSDVNSYIAASLIYLDIAPHDSIQEKLLFDKLQSSSYKGILVCDDINYNQAMMDFWDWVPLKKIDASSYGSHSGTGIIIFEPSFIDVTML